MDAKEYFDNKIAQPETGNLSFGEGKRMDAVKLQKDWKNTSIANAEALGCKLAEEDAFLMWTISRHFGF